MSRFVPLLVFETGLLFLFLQTSLDARNFTFPLFFLHLGAKGEELFRADPYSFFLLGPPVYGEGCRLIFPLSRKRGGSFLKLLFSLLNKNPRISSLPPPPFSQWEGKTSSGLPFHPLEPALFLNRKKTLPSFPSRSHKNVMEIDPGPLSSRNSLPPFPAEDLKKKLFLLLSTTEGT